nr:putative ribonuclease H-like domain-containing protein [Tanacetum cinerariifolium]
KEDIQTYTKIRSKQKLFQFLNGLDRKFELIKREILRVDPLPTAEDAYATVHKEAAHQIILGVTNNETHGIATGLIAEETDGMASNKGAKKDKPSTSPTANTRKSTKNSNDRRSEGGFEGVAAVVEEEGEESFSVKGRDGLLDVALKEMDYTMLMRYGVNKKGYRCYSPKTHRLFTSMNFDFLETQYYYSPQHSGQGEKQGNPLSWLSYTSAATIGNEIQNHSTTSAEAPNISATPKYPVPDMMSEALKSEKWKNAMDDEMKALKKNKTWDQCALPQGKKPVGCQWIFTLKYKPDGTVKLAKMDTIRVMLSVASNQGWSLHQFDVKNSFLHGELKEEVYMEAPPGFSEHFKPGEACRLKKYLYGLKQSPKAWFERFTLAIKMYGLKESNLDHTLFLKNRKNRVTCLIIYVDDMVITGNDEE